MGKSITERMLEEYDTFTAAERKIADYVLANQKKCQGLGITELSAECNVAVSTVSVFCRKLKLAGFHDFKLELARANIMNVHHTQEEGGSEIELGDSPEQVLTKTRLREEEVLRHSAQLLNPELLEQAVELLLEANHVLFLGQGNHSSVAMMAWTQFAVIESKFQTILDSHMQTVAMANLSPGDVVVYFSYTGATLEILDAVETIRQVGAKLVLVTRFSRSPAAEHADVVLLSGAEERPLQFGSFDALFSQLYVVDALYTRYCMRCGRPLEQRRELVGKELSRKHL